MISVEVKLYAGLFGNELVTVEQVAGSAWHVYLGMYECLTRGDMRRLARGKRYGFVMHLGLRKVLDFVRIGEYVCVWGWLV